MILSIGMIVKNEEKYLERCLTALKPVLDSVDSELIIADTGSTDSTVEIAKKFTDNVIHFDWINDFAAARNATLDRASGEWYMFIDADEIFQDCSDLINFFNSGEYKKYNSATLIIRSYSTEGSDAFMDFRAFRLTSKREEVRFENPVHESLVPVTAPVKNLDLVADHYGYVYYKSDGSLTELAREKIDRNLKLLLEELSELEAKGICRELIYNQIADCYHVLMMNDKALEYVNMGLEKLNKSDFTVILYYSHKFALLLNEERYEELIELSELYFGKNSNPARIKTLATDIYVYGARAASCYQLDRFADAIPDFLKCFELYRQYTDQKLITEDLLFGSFRVTRGFIQNAYRIFCECCISTGRYDAVNAADKQFPLGECFSNRQFMFAYILFHIEIMENTNYNKLSELYYRLDEPSRKLLIRSARWQLFNTDKPDQIIKGLGGFAKNDPVLKDALEIYHSFCISRNLNFEQLTEFISKYPARENEDIWCIMLSKNYDITPFINAQDFSAEECTRTVYINYPASLGAAELFKGYDVNNVSSKGLEKAVDVFGWAMIGALHNKLDITRAFEQFGQLGMRWFNDHSDTENVSGNIKAAIMANNITAARERGDIKRCVEEMRRMSSVCPAMAPFVSEYAKYIRAETQPARPAVNPEFAQLAVQVKQNIRDMIAAGDLDNAQNTLAELEELCPLDPEIEILKEEIFTKKTKE